MTVVEDRPAPGVLRLVLDRPARRNAIDTRMVTQLTEALTQPRADVVVIGSTDGRAFSAGADTTMPDLERAALSDRLYSLYQRMIDLPVPIIAAANGHAVGGGAQLLIASDVRVAGPELRVRFAGAGHGLAVGAWGLPSLVGRGRALELCLSMRTIDAREALAIGLVDRMSDDPDEDGLRLARHVASLDQAAVARLKGVTTTATAVRDALDRERRENRNAWSGGLSTGRVSP